MDCLCIGKEEGVEMGFLSIFKKKSKEECVPTNELPSLDSLPPISPEEQQEVQQDKLQQEVQQAPLPSQEQSSFEEREALQHHDQLPEDDSSYIQKEQGFVDDSDLHSIQEISNKNAKQEIGEQEANASLNFSPSQSLETISVPNLDTTKEITFEGAKNNSQNKELESEQKPKAQPNIFIKAQEEKEEHKESPSLFSEKNVFLKEEKSVHQFANDDVLFDDLPTFDDVEAVDEASGFQGVAEEEIELPKHPQLNGVKEIFVEKHKYATMFSSWKTEVDTLKEKLQAEKTFDYYDAKLQQLFTRSQVSFAQIQKKLLFAEKIFSSEQKSQ